MERIETLRTELRDLLLTLYSELVPNRKGTFLGEAEYMSDVIMQN